jgi:hypothetical protein
VLYEETTMQKTRHTRPGRRTIELEGQHLWEITATSADGQIATAVVAADDEWKARTCLMLVQTTMRLCGQLVEYQIRQIDTESADQAETP